MFIWLAWLLVDRQTLSPLSIRSVSYSHFLSLFPSLSQSQLRRNRIKGSVHLKSCQLALPLLLRPNGGAAHPSAALASPFPIHCLSFHSLTASSSLAGTLLHPITCSYSHCAWTIVRGGSLITARELFYTTLKTMNRKSFLPTDYHAFLLLVVADRLRLVSRKPVSSSISSYLI